MREARARDAGYRLASFRDVDPHRLHRLEMEAADDVPDGEPPHEISFDEWRSEIAEQPNLDWDASSVVLLGDESVSESLLTVDLEGRRARNEGTGTARAHRRRGLATLAKLATTRWALEHGIQTIVTDNAEENTAMLAIDERLGYRPIVERRRWAKELVSK